MGLLLLLGLAPLRSALAQNPFLIDGNIPDAGVADNFFTDPYGSVQELGPLNGSSTKIGVVHTAATPMLNFTNPNGQTDLITVWLDTAVATDGDIWLYFAWERDATSGSSVITYEFQHAAFPAGCLYTDDTDWVEPVHPDEADLIENCNPWSGRQDGDFLIVWDFKGGAEEIILRDFNGLTFGVGEEILDASVSKAALNESTSRGEGAINLSDTVFDSSTCTSIGSVITGTVTGNSDSADYKDTVFADVADKLSISNCGTVKITKETDPPGAAGSFAFTHNLNFLPASAASGFNLSDTEVYEPTNVVVPGTGYFVDETDPGSNFDLTEIDCSESDATVSYSTEPLADGRVTFDLDRGETLDCTFTNTKRGQIKLVKNATGGNGTFNFTHSIAGLAASLTTSGGSADDTSDPLVPGTYSISEDSLSGWDMTSASCNDGSDPSSINLAAGELVICTFTNTKRGQIKLVKNATGGNGTFNFTHSIAGLAASLTTSGGTADDTSDPLVPGTYSVSENVTAGWDLTSASCNDGSDPSSIDLAAGELVICTFTNTLQKGAIRIQKTRKYAAAADDAEFDGDASDEPHAGVAFEISGNSLNQAVKLTTNVSGVVCSDGLVFGDYTVTEIVPAGYVADGDAEATPGDPAATPPVSYSKTVTVDQKGTCDDDGEEVVTFSNTPLTNVTVNAAAQDADATRSRINCYQATMEGGEITLGDLINTVNEDFTDDTTVALDDQLPGYPDSLIVCTVEIDP